MKLLITLPDEIINEILSSTLDLPDETFASTAQISPFSHYKLTTSTILPVCKAWLCIATPLLYHTMVLRSTAQEQALARTLEEDAHLGRFTRKFHLEGGLGDAVYDILQRDPGLTDLCISGSPSPTASIEGYHRAFKHVYLNDDSHNYARSAREELTIALADAIRDAWTTLVTFEMDVSPLSHPKMVMEILKTRALAELKLRCQAFGQSARGLVHQTLGPLYKFLEANHSVYGKVLFTGHDLLVLDSQKTAVFQSLPADSQYLPLEGVDHDLRAAVWTRPPVCYRFGGHASDYWSPLFGHFHVPSRGIVSPSGIQAFRAPRVKRVQSGLCSATLIRGTHGLEGFYVQTPCPAWLLVVASSGGVYSRGSGRLLVFMASSSFSRTGGLQISYSVLIHASSILEHLPASVTGGN
ncbi:hypothetical protein BKA70DRAFT_1178764 [Coprinopsis sp. MPI-PUGE-AT-0042]|nr:hypothetical protein BKA70DRAFT_1178764 [Coprinopsis sp. MPI-PUGE-AT-0042]